MPVDTFFDKLVKLEVERWLIGSVCRLRKVSEFFVKVAESTVRIIECLPVVVFDCKKKGTRLKVPKWIWIMR